MADLYEVSEKKNEYWDRQTYNSLEDQIKAFENTCTVYVGNLSFYTTEVQIMELFSRLGHVYRIIMGLDRVKKTPCGFCFVEFAQHKQAQMAVDYICGSKLDNRVIRVGLDGGFKEGRQYGRGKSGGQIRDERRSAKDYDPGRGGYGQGSTFQRNEKSRPFRMYQGKRKYSNSGENQNYYKEDDSVEKMEEIPKEKNPRFQSAESNDEADDEEEALNGSSIVVEE